VVSAARAPIAITTFSIRFDSPPTLKSGHLYIIIFIIIIIIIRYRYYGYIIIVIMGVKRGPRASPSLRF